MTLYGVRSGQVRSGQVPGDIGGCSRMDGCIRSHRSRIDKMVRDRRRVEAIIESSVIDD